MKKIREELNKAIKAIKIGVNSREQEQLSGELALFLQWLQPLQAVNTDGIEQVLISHGAVNVLREDKAQPDKPADLQKAAPRFEDGFYHVPPIIE